MDTKELTSFEMQALLEFIKEYGTRDNLSVFTSATVRHLFLAYLKLQRAKEYWDEAMAYTE